MSRFTILQVVLGVIVVGLFVVFMQSPADVLNPDSGIDANMDTLAISDPRLLPIQNAFLPVVEQKYFIEPEPSANENPVNVIEPEKNTTTTPVPIPIETKPVLVKNQLPSNALTLPFIASSELVISNKGVASEKEYVNHFSDHSVTDIIFNYKDLDKVVADEYGVALPPQDLVTRILSVGDAQKYRESLIVWRKFIEAKIVFLKKIDVSSSLVDFHKKIIGVDMLTIALIDKALLLGNGSITPREFLDFRAGYIATTEFYGEEFRRKNLAIVEKEKSFIEVVLEKIKLWKYVFAETTARNRPLGGEIKSVVACTCDPRGSQVTVDSSVAGASQYGGIMYFTTAFIASPVFYTKNTALKNNTWVLGLYDVVSPALSCYPVEKEICEEFATSTPGSTSTHTQCRIEEVCDPQLSNIVVAAGIAPKK